MSNQQFQVPPQVEALFKNARQIVVGALVLVLVWTGFFQIGAEEVGVITRFGKYTREVNSGLNFKIPLIEGVVKVPVERQQKQEFGFRTVERSEERRVGKEER